MGVIFSRTEVEAGLTKDRLPSPPPIQMASRRRSPLSCFTTAVSLAHTRRSHGHQSAVRCQPCAIRFLCSLLRPPGPHPDPAAFLFSLSDGKPPEQGGRVPCRLFQFQNKGYSVWHAKDKGPLFGIGAGTLSHPLSLCNLSLRSRSAAGRLCLSLHRVAHETAATAFSHRPDRTRPTPQAQTWGWIWTKSDCSAAAPTWATPTPSLASVSPSPSSRHLTSPASSCVKLPTPTCHTTLPTCASIWPCLARALACKTLAAVHTISRRSA